MTILRAAAISALLLSSAACGIGVDAKDSGPAVDRAYPIGAFTRIAVAGPYEVTVNAAGKPGVTAHGGANLLDETIVEVVNGELRIHTREHHGFNWGWHRDGKTTLVVSGASAISEAAIAGSGGIHLDRAAGPRFKGSVAGSGDLNVAALDTQSAELGIAGSGDIRVAGKAGSAKLDIAGSGDIDTPALQTIDSTISIAGSGNVRAHATRTASVTVLGSGDVTLTGGAKCTVEKHGSGNVNCS